MLNQSLLSEDLFGCISTITMQPWQRYPPTRTTPNLQSMPIYGAFEGKANSTKGIEKLYFESISIWKHSLNFMMCHAHFGMQLR